MRMQKVPSSSATDEEISEIQNDPEVQKLFQDAKEVLRLAGAEENATGKCAYYYLFQFKAQNTY